MAGLTLKRYDIKVAIGIQLTINLETNLQKHIF